MIGSAVFAQLTGVPNRYIDTQTDNPTYIAIGCLYALRAGDAA